MRFVRRSAAPAKKLAVLAAAFHPPTVAHVALLEAALGGGIADQALCVLPERFPHKEYGPVGLETRLEMLLAATAMDSRVSVAVTDGGLFLEIAAECRAAYGDSVRIGFLCGRDAAERVIGWTYQEGASIGEQLREFELLVAPREGLFEAPGHLAHAVRPIEVDETLAAVSSTEVRRRIVAGEPWEDLVPEPVRALVRRHYANRGPLFV